ncbi:MAG TPA: secretin N-terminal domain-containing protein [Chthoniobacterales bacterium]|nr:secretin N-terminal domain-containing protein [Chthoniobacterales bacterium]
MATFTFKLTCATIAFLAAMSASFGQATSPAPQSTEKPAATANSPKNADKSESGAAPLTVVQATSATQAPAAPKTAAPPPSTSTPATTVVPPSAAESAVESGGVGVREFQGDDVGQVLRLLARQAKVNMVVSDQVTGTVTMRLEDVTALQAIAIIVKAKGLFLDQIDHVYYIKTAAEKTAEPTESDSYQFSYSRAKEVAPLLASQLASKDPPQFDERTNTIFFRETRSNLDNIRKLLVTIDKPTKQVMIEARLVEVTANPNQSYGIDWAGTFGSASAGKTFTYGAPAQTTTSTNGKVNTGDFALGNPANPNFIGSFGKLAFGQFAILTVPQFSATLRLLNEDNDAEFLANPRIVTADNLQAKIEINRAQPVPQLNFNEQTATAVFGGFQDKKFGNTLIVTPSINKDNFVTMKVKPEISNKVGDASFIFAGATVQSPIIDTRTLESNVLIRSGDTLAIGGLLQDEVAKAHNKVPLIGDVPVLGYLFQNHLNARTKRNLLVFVTPTIISSKYGTGLEDQVSGLHHVGDEYADINGWRNNAKGAVRLVPTGNRQVAADYPKPGTPPPPAMGEDVQFKSSAKDRDF